MHFVEFSPLFQPTLFCVCMHACKGMEKMTQPGHKPRSLICVSVGLKTPIPLFSSFLTPSVSPSTWASKGSGEKEKWWLWNYLNRGSSNQQTSKTSSQNTTIRTSEWDTYASSPTCYTIVGRHERPRQGNYLITALQIRKSAPITDLDKWTGRELENGKRLKSTHFIANWWTPSSKQKAKEKKKGKFLFWDSSLHEKAIISGSLHKWWRNQ